MRVWGLRVGIPHVEPHPPLHLSLSLSLSPSLSLSHTQTHSAAPHPPLHRSLSLPPFRSKNMTLLERFRGVVVLASKAAAQRHDVGACSRSPSLSLSHTHTPRAPSRTLRCISLLPSLPPSLPFSPSLSLSLSHTRWVCCKAVSCAGKQQARTLNPW